MREGILHHYGSDLVRLLRILDVFIPAWLFWLIARWDGVTIESPWFWIFPISVGILSALIFPLSGLYENYRQRSLFTLLRQLTISWLMVLSALLLEAFAAKVTSRFSRLDVGLWALLVWLILVGIHVGGRKLLRLYRMRGGNSRSVLFWGSPESAMRVFRELDSLSHLGLRFVAWFSPTPEESLLLPAGMPNCSGGLREMRQWLNKYHADHIFFNHCSNEVVSIDELLCMFGDTCSPVHYIPEWAYPSMCFHAEQLGSTFCIGLWGNRPAMLDLQLKRLMDILVSAALIALLSPLLLVIAVLIRITSPGPVFFRQVRYGIDGRQFKILKFRTMSVVERGDQPGLRQATRNDPRVTPLGRVLRKWSLDELPQLFNVLSGSMSLVGPRPHAVDHNEFYRTRIAGYMARHLCKPGITGLAQVDGWRGETAELEAMAKRVDADLRYQREWSLILDIKIFLRTLFSIRSPNAF